MVGTLVLVLLPSSFFSEPASATCPLRGDNYIIAKDQGRSGNTIGNAGDVYVNDLGGTEHGIVRTMLSGTDIWGNYIEWGWMIGEAFGTAGQHRAFTAHSLNGSYQGFTLRENVNRATWYRFKLQDGDRDTVWRFFLNGNERSFTLNHNFSDSGAFAMSEREANCDTGYGSFEHLTNCISGGCSNYWNWLNLGCRYDSLSGYKFNRIHSIKFSTIEGDGPC